MENDPNSQPGSAPISPQNSAPNALFDLTGKVALLTGAARGIGLAMAQSLASAGCAVAIQDIELGIAEKEAHAINQAGGKAMAFGGDVFDLTLPARLIGQVIEALGRLDVLVNNAAIQQEKHWEELSADEINHIFQADIVCPILFIQQAWAVFKKQRFGRIINIGSVQQRGANPKMFAYSISKGALEKITIGLCRQMAKENVTINQIAPGWINTDRNRHHLTSPAAVKEAGAKHVPFGRLGEPSDFRGIILLLCSDAGSYITGQTIFVDGAFSM